MKKFVATALAMLIACATIIRPGPDRIPVDSSPRGARVYLDGQLVGTTPVVVDVPRKSDCVIRVELEGYEPVEIDRDKKLNGWFLANILLGGVIGIIVDLATSNQGLYSQEPIFVEFTALKKDGTRQTFYVPMNPKRPEKRLSDRSTTNQ